MRRRCTSGRMAALVCLLLVLPAAAQDEQPAVTPEPGGTTIVGDRDTAVGLFVTPWQEPSATALDRAPGPYDVPMEPVDIERFRRLADYDRVSRDYARERWLEGR